MHHIGVAKHSGDLADGIGFPNIGQELITKPFPWEAPFTIPAISTKETVAGKIFAELNISASFFRRGSGSGTTPTLGSIVANG